MEFLMTLGQVVAAAAVGLILRAQQRILDKALAERQQLAQTVCHLSEININLQEYTANADIIAVERGRNRIMREMHDTAGHALSSLIMMLEAARQMALTGKETTVRQIDLAIGVVHECLLEVRRLTHGLKPSPLERERGLAAIKKLAETCAKNTEVKIVVSFGDTPRCSIPPELDIVLYRAAQEGLTNALRHGFARRVDISLQREKGGLSLRVMDDGGGCASYSEGGGLTGLRQRVAEAGGTVETQSWVGQGFLLNVWLPLKVEDCVADSAAARG